MSYELVCFSHSFFRSQSSSLSTVFLIFSPSELLTFCFYTPFPKALKLKSEKEHAGVILHPVLCIRVMYPFEV